MNGGRNGRDRSGGMAVFLAIALGGLLLVMGFTSSMQTSMGRSMLERVMLYRAMDRAAESCFEEASARLEKQFEQIEFSRPGEHRDLNTVLTWPASIDLSLTPTQFEKQGVQTGPVKIRTSRFLNFQVVEEDRSLLCLERGYVEMKVEIRLKRGRISLGREVTCRRIMYAEPVTGQPKLHLKVQAANLLRVMKEI